MKLCIIHDIEYDDVSELDTWWHVQFDKSFWWQEALIINILRCGWADWQVYWAEKIERVVISDELIHYDAYPTILLGDDHTLIIDDLISNVPE